MSTRQAIDPTPLRPVDMEILLVLASRDLHGYGLLKEIARHAKGGVRLEVGSLYRVLNRLLAAGLIADDGKPPADADTRRRSYYRITDQGRHAVAAEAERLAAVVSKARRLVGAGGDASES